MTTQQSPDLAAQRLCQFLTFCQQFQADLGDLSAFLLDEYPNVSFSSCWHLYPTMYSLINSWINA